MCIDWQFVHCILVCYVYVIFICILIYTNFVNRKKFYSTPSTWWSRMCVCVRVCVCYGLQNTTRKWHLLGHSVRFGSLISKSRTISGFKKLPPVQYHGSHFGAQLPQKSSLTPERGVVRKAAHVHKLRVPAPCFDNSNEEVTNINNNCHHGDGN